MSRIRREYLRFKAWLLLGQPRLHVYGEFTAINPRAITIGPNCAINPGVLMNAMAGITIGRNVVLSARCMLIDGGLDVDSPVPMVDKPHAGRPITIGDGAWIGAGAIILAGVTIGENSVVGAGSVVTKDVPPSTVVAGNPARVLRRVGGGEKPAK